MRLTWWLGTVAMMFLRLWLLGLMLASGSPVALAISLTEVLSLAYGIANLFASRWRDYSWGGLWVALAYAAGVFVLPRSGASSPLAFALMASGLVLSVWALFCLRSRFTVGGTSWVSLCSVGPYKYIRHPQLTARLLIISAACLASLNPLGIFLCMLSAILTLTVMAVEERGLSSIPEYVEYSRLVPFRSVPGLL